MEGDRDGTLEEVALAYREIAAPPGLDQLIHCVWFLTGGAEEYLPQPVVPDGRLELLIHRADPFRRMGPNGSVEVQDAILVAGQLTHPIHLQPGSAIDVVGVRLNPVGARRLLGIPLYELTNAVISLREIRPGIAKVLADSAATQGTGTERAFGIMRALHRALLGTPDRRMIAAARCLARGFQGSVRVMASKYGMSPKTLERQFQSEVGLSPKMYQRVVRFRRAFRLLENGEESGARIAAAGGYYDQAHLIRDFKQFAGTSPRRFFRPETPLAGLLLSGLAADAAHREVDAVGRAALGTFDPRHQ